MASKGDKIMKSVNTKYHVGLLARIILLALSFVLITGVAFSGELKTPQIAVTLPEKYNTPDGMALGPDGDIYLSVPNFGNAEFPAGIVKIDKNHRVSFVMGLPAHPETNKVAPLGSAFGSDGNLYIADCQAFVGGKNAGRLLRVVMMNGQGIKAESVVEGMIFPNAVAARGDYIYLTETTLNATAKYPAQSAVYRFAISELKGPDPIKIKPEGADPHLYATIYTQNTANGMGANGLDFDAKGNMYVANFGDATIHKFTIKEDGSLDSHTILTGGSGMVTCDGIRVDPRNGDIYVADFLGNAIHKVDPATGQVTTIAKNPHGDGTDGQLDGCSEVIIRGNTMYISNIDLDFGPSKHDTLHTISMINLD